MDIVQLEDKLPYRDFIIRIFKWLVIGLGLTFISSLLFYFSGISYYLGMIILLVPVIEIIMVLFLAKNIENLSYSKSKKWFYAYSIINGITFSILCDFVAPGAFILASAMTIAYFGLLYAISANTTYDFTNIGKMCLLALIPLCIGFLICIFLNLSALYMILITVDLIIFTGITLYDFKRINASYEKATFETQDVLILDCAFNLYLDFVNIFYDILMLLDDFS